MVLRAKHDGCHSCSYCCIVLQQPWRLSFVLPTRFIALVADQTCRKANIFFSKLHTIKIILCYVFFPGVARLVYDICIHHQYIIFCTLTTLSSRTRFQIFIYCFLLIRSTKLYYPLFLFLKLCSWTGEV